MKRMRKLIIWSILLVSLSLVAQVQANIPLSKGSTNYNINTVDTNSLYTRSDVYEFKNVNASEIAPIIIKTLSLYGTISINETLNMIIINEQESKLKNIINLCIKLDVKDMDAYQKIMTERILLSYTQPEDIKEYLTSHLSIDGFIHADNDYNALIIHDHISKIELIKEEIKKYDLPPKEVKLNVEIFELSSDGMSELGIDIDKGMEAILVDISKYDYKDYLFQKREGESLYSSPLNQKTVENRDRIESDLDMEITLSNLIRFFKKNEGFKIVSSPSVTTLNNTTAQLGISGNIDMSITPHIGESDYIKLSLDCNISAKSPSQHLISEVYLKNGEPFILGEYTEVRKLKITKKVPILGSILPFLFSRKYESDKKVKIVIFLTPEIVELDRYSEDSLEMKQQMMLDK
ncbi:MAG: hypothetical protein K8S23_16975 [Candidatus Cloacimonetes bacterium]|nr:hypothetical protein [Candidatus Cloacimonadota bacterium]